MKQDARHYFIKIRSLTADFRPEIVVRVFNAKLKQLISSIQNKRIFGAVKAIIYTIEFQKRGLPHAHILITLEENNRINCWCD